MRYIEAPTEYERDRREGPVLFLAGGITDTENWQIRIMNLLAEAELVLLNPRRRSFPAGDPNAEVAQIGWEYRHMQRADAVAFWFPGETLCPIALYELGMQIGDGRSLFVGTHPDYQRRRDLDVQLRLARPEVRIVHTVEALAAQVRNALGTGLIPEEDRR